MPKRPESEAQHELAALIHKNSDIDLRVWAKTMRRYGEILEDMLAVVDKADTGFCCMCDTRLDESGTHLCKKEVQAV